ncbi:MAG: hypothetical protein WDM86_04585 [Rhizomicrobium sp.]
MENQVRRHAIVAGIAVERARVDRNLFARQRLLGEIARDLGRRTAFGRRRRQAAKHRRCERRGGERAQQEFPCPFRRKMRLFSMIVSILFLRFAPDTPAAQASGKLR